MPEELFVRPVSLDLAFNDPDENLKLIEAALRMRVPDSDVSPEKQLFVFPELALTGFVTKNPAGFKPADAPVRRLGELARDFGTALAAGFPETNPADPKKPFNTLALFSPDGRMAASYRKMHLFTVGREPESKAYSAGDSGRIVLYRGWRIALSLCFDLRFARLYHTYARAGADLILAPSCWVGGPHKSYQFKTLGSAQAILSQAYLVSVNRSGRDPNFEFDGAQYVFSPFGEDLYSGKPCLLDSGELEAARRLSVSSADRDDYQVKGT